MQPEIHWIEAPVVGRLAIMPRPRAGDWLEDEIAGWRDAGIEIVVSLLETGEVAELELEREAMLCRALGMEFVAFPIPDRGLPGSVRETSTLARRLAMRLDEGKAVAVHCRAGIGRSSIIAACTLVCAGIGADAALAMIEMARGVPVPDTEAQRAWVLSFQAAGYG
jgi:protein-tyrosine phosphatase